MRITVLGCGASSGIPLVGCDCEVCTSHNRKNKRSRASICIESGESRLLVDTSPDLRQQLLDNHISKVDAIFYTHAHADHCHGIDDVRSLNYCAGAALPAFLDDATLTELQKRFGYVFHPAEKMTVWYRPHLIPHVIDTQNYAPVQVTPELKVVPFEQWHGQSLTLGLRVGNFAYSTDVNNLPEESFQALENLDVWLVDCLRYNVAPTHAHLEMTLEWIRRVKPRRAILTHMGHELGYEILKSQLPAGVEPAYDGMVIEL